MSLLATKASRGTALSRPAWSRRGVPVRLFVCGARGSTAAPGPDFVRYGGHTSCVAISRSPQERPCLILDAGTGIRNVSGLLDNDPFTGTLLLGHMHWDHTEGLPFFTSGDNELAEVRMLMPDQGDPVTLLERFMSPPFFPIPPSGLRGKWSFDVLDEGKHEIEGFDVLAREIPHKGGLTFGYRITDGTGVLAYASDHSPTSKGPGPDGLGELHEDILEIARGADVLIHDAQHTLEEFGPVAHFGHASIDYAISLAEAAEVERLLLFHHSPARTDDQLDAILRSLPDSPVAIEAATEGTYLDI